MRDLGNRKWLASSCGVIGLAAVLALSLKVPIHGAPRIGALPQASGALRSNASPKITFKSADTARVVKQYGQMPLAFEPNSSATNSPAKYLARGSGYTLFLANQEAVLELRGNSKRPAVVRMELAGANASPKFSALEELPGKSNYFIGNDPKKWRTNVPQYRKVMEHGVYPGVNLVYYGTQGRLEYDFDVAPGIDPSVIQLAFKGTGDVRIDAQGELTVNTDAGEVRMRKPVAYQEIGGAKKSVAVGYALKDKTSATFQIAKYDSSLPLIIDPILSYSTYLGGSNIDSSNSIAVAPDNTAFIAGGTFSADFPVVHALQPNMGGGPDAPQDAFVSKISVDGSTLLYSTYLGGENEDFATGIAVDNSGNAYVTGQTISPGFPTTLDAVNRLCGADGKCGTSWNMLGLMVTNAFVSKLNAAGSGLLYSSFLGEYEDVSGQAIAVDGNGNAYVTGQVTDNYTPTVTITPPAVGPPPFPITGTAFQASHGTGNWNAFITEIDSSGSTVLYSSYLGGNTEDTGYGIAVDATGDAYITGLTYSTNLATTVGALQPAYGGAGDGFVGKVNTTASGAASLVFLTYLGGSGLDQGSAIALDSTGNAYITGATNSASFAGFTPAGFQTVYAGEGDAFVAKLTSTGAFSYFTYLGGSLADAGTGIAVDASNNAYITGTTVSQNFPTSGAVFQPAYGGGNADSFVAKLDHTGTILIYSSYLGGTNTELATGIAVDTSGSAYVTGQTCSQDFPLANPLQSAPGGNCDAYVAKVSILPGFAFNPAGLVFTAQSQNTTSQPQVITLTNGESAQTITSITIIGTNAGDFAQTNTCVGAIAVGATCPISITFTPSAPGIRKASVTIIDSAPGSPHVINLSGNTSTVTLSAASLSFGQQAVGTPSAIQSVEVTNSGTTTLTFASVSASGDFVEANNCTTASLYPGTTCVIQVQFLPSAPVASTGAITLVDSAAGSPQVILATGTGILEPQAVLNPLNLGFSTEPIGTVSPAQNVTLTNTGQSPMNVGPISASGDFGEVNNCPSMLAQNTSCVISVTFDPTAAGTRTGTLTVTDNSGNNPATTQTVSLTGTGQTVAAVTISPSSLTFGSTNPGATSAAQVVTITNSGSAPLTVSNVSITGDFAQMNNCTASIPAGGTCTMNVTFTPTAFGSRFGTITVTDNAATSPQSIPLSGLTTSMPIAVVSTNTLTFASQNVETISAAQNVYLANGGNVPLTISGITATGDFAQTNNCGASIAASAACTITVTFTPTAAGTRTGLITISDNATPPTQAVSLTGTGASFQISATSSSGVAIPAGQTATFPITISASAGFSQAVTLSCSLPSGVGTCAIAPTTVTPTAGASQSANLTVTTMVRNLAPPVTGIKINPFGGLRPFNLPFLTWLALILAALTLAAIRQRPLTAAFGFTVVLLLASVACGGAGTAQAPGQASGTPAGTYAITVTGTSGTVTSSMQFTLQVN